MEQNIEINGCGYTVKGQWSVDGMSLLFKGVAVNSETNKTASLIEYSFPLSFQRKFGKAAMEEEIVVSFPSSSLGTHTFKLCLTLSSKQSLSGSHSQARAWERDIKR